MTIAFNYLGKLGQLGNQMFQYAASLGAARYHGVTFTGSPVGTVVNGKFKMKNGKLLGDPEGKPLEFN